MNLTLSIILVICACIIALGNILLIVMLTLILLKVKYVLEQVEKFSNTISQFSSSWGKILSGILTFLIDFRNKTKKKKKEEDEDE